MGGVLGVQYHVLAIYQDTVWALRINEGVSAQGQPKEPENYSREFFNSERVKLHRDVLANHIERDRQRVA
jgi:hypothetical protein